MAKLNYDLKDIYDWPLKAQALLLGLCSLVILYLGYLLDLSLLNKQQQASYQQEKNFKLQFQTLVEKEKQIKQEIDQIPLLKQALANYESHMVTEKEMTPVLDQILKLGQNGHLQFHYFEPGKNMKKMFVSTPVRVKVTGTYTQIASFISNLANLNKMVQINDFTLSNTKTNRENETPQGPDTPLNMDLNFDIYRK